MNTARAGSNGLWRESCEILRAQMRAYNLAQLLQFP